jgi:hypothetical protein
LKTKASSEVPGLKLKLAILILANSGQEPWLLIKKKKKKATASKTKTRRSNLVKFDK